MNQEEILNMPAGQDMDLLVAEKVLQLSTDDWNKRFFANATKYSSNISNAWEVIEKMTDYEVHIMSGLNFKRYPNMPYGAKFENKKFSFVALGATAPLAICRAALLAAMSR